MQKVKTIHLEPGETAIIKMADSSSNSEVFYSITKGAELIKVNRSTIYRAETKGIISLDRTQKSPRISETELLKLKK